MRLNAEAMFFSSFGLYGFIEKRQPRMFLQKNPPPEGRGEFLDGEEIIEVFLLLREPFVLADCCSILL